MTRGLPARVAVLCALLAGGREARAEQKPRVAVVDLSGEAEAARLADDLYNVLFNHDQLSPLQDVKLVPLLSGALADEDAPRLTRAREARARAEEALDQGDFKTAEGAATDGQRDLMAVIPTPDSLGIFAELGIDLGTAQLYQRKINDANRTFTVMHRLDPMRQLDPMRYPPDIRDAYAKAIPGAGAPVKLEVQGKGHLWIDGIERGDAPGTFDVEPGPHLVQLAGPDRETRGNVVLAPGALALEDAPATAEQRVMRARLALARTPDAAARAGAMQQLAQLLGIHDAVLISRSPAGALLVQTWQDRAPGFSALREHTSEPTGELLVPLAPPKPVKPPEPPHVIPTPFVPPPHHEDEPPWYRQRWVQGSVAVGVLGAVVGTVLWARRTHDLMIDPNIQSK